MLIFTTVKLSKVRASTRSEGSGRSKIFPDDWGEPTHCSANFFEKLHESKKDWVKTGGGRVPAPAP